jgi:hypothetical protein
LYSAIAEPRTPARYLPSALLHLLPGITYLEPPPRALDGQDLTHLRAHLRPYTPRTSTTRSRRFPRPPRPPRSPSPSSRPRTRPVSSHSTVNTRGATLAQAARITRLLLLPARQGRPPQAPPLPASLPPPPLVLQPARVGQQLRRFRGLGPSQP